MLFVEDGLLFRIAFNQEPIRCIAGGEVAKVLQETQFRGLWRASKGLKIIQTDYAPWLLVANYGGVILCPLLEDNRIHTPTVELHSLSTP